MKFKIIFAFPNFPQLMSEKAIYVLHKNGADSHYTALDCLLKQHSKTLIYREFSIFSKLIKAIKTRNLSLFKKQWINLFFLIELLFTRDKKIVLGIAPFDSKIGNLLSILGKHEIYYHTSWVCWDKSFHPKIKKNSPKVFDTWKNFLEQQVKHIFCVTEASKRSILDNYQISEDRIEAVFHSLDQKFLSKCSEFTRKENSFIYVGRLVEQKGIEEALDFFANNKDTSLTIIGNGKKKSLVEEYASKNDNIVYKEYVSDKAELINEFNKHHFLLLNSKKNKKWEELFGMVIIEGMSQGVIPVATNHPGPREIISEDIGVLFNEEDKLDDILNSVINNPNFNNEMSEACKAASNIYRPENLAERWRIILN